MQAKIVQITEKRKRAPAEGTEMRQVANKQQRLDAREAILALPAPVERMTTLRELRILKLKEAEAEI